jgi:hypothetical protein
MVSQFALQAAGGYFLALAVLYGILHTTLVPSKCSSLKGLNEADCHGVHTRVMAGLHCFVSSLGAAFLLQSNLLWLGFPLFFDGNPTTQVAYAEILVAMEISELLFTSILNMLNGEEWMIHAHHIAGLAAEVPCLYFGQGFTILLWVHLAQFTQPFLYGSWICFKLNWTSGFLFPFCSGMALIFWFILRVVISGFPVLYSIYNTRSLYENSAHWYVMLASQTVFMLLNLHWFKYMVARAISTFSGGAAKAKKK